MNSTSIQDCQLLGEMQGGSEKQTNYVAVEQEMEWSETGTFTDTDLQAMIDRANQMQQAAAALDEAQSVVDRVMGKICKNTIPLLGSRVEADNRSIYVGNVDYSATAADLQDHFTSSGKMKRITILRNSSGHPKGCAYVEFAEESSVQQAMEIDGSLFKGRLIKVNPKRTNIPGKSATRGSRGGTRGTASSTRGVTRGGYRGRGSSCGVSYLRIRPRSDYRFVSIKPY